jgi:Tfp pilus assembly protein PilP
MKPARATMWMLCATFAGSSLSAQTPVPAPTPPGAASAPSTIRVGSRVGETPTEYDDGGRRDPFVSLIVPKVAPSSAAGAAARPRFVAGLAGISISDVVVKGTVRSGDTLIALLQGPDGKTYMAKRLDRLQDGVVTRIDSDGVVFTERTADAAGVVRARDVRKPLRPAVSGSGGQS